MSSVSADLRVESLTVSFRDQDQVVQPLQDLSFAASDGQVVVAMGPSGCGKTTLLSVLAGLLTPDSGTVTFAGREVTGMSPKALLEHRRRTVGIVFQAFNLVPSLTALENVMAPLLLTGVRTRTARREAMELLDEVSLADETHRRPGRLSGGQQQRVAFARALTGGPALLLADEPTAHLDPDQVDNVLRLIADLRSQGRLVLVSTHDVRFAEIADAYVRLGTSPRADDATVPGPSARGGGAGGTASVTRAAAQPGGRPLILITLRDMQWRARRVLLGLAATALVLAMTSLLGALHDGLPARDRPHDRLLRRRPVAGGFPGRGSVHVEHPGPDLAGGRGRARLRRSRRHAGRHLPARGARGRTTASPTST